MEDNFSIGSIIYICLLIAAWIGALVNSKVWKWTLKVVLAKNLWLIYTGSVLAVMLGAYTLFPEEVMLSEIALISVVSLLMLFPLLIFLYYHFTDMEDYEIWNGWISYTGFRESYYTKHTYTTTDKDGNTTTHTTYVYHPEEWWLTTSNGKKVYVTKTVYKNISKHYGYSHTDTSYGIGYDKKSSFTTCGKYYTTAYEFRVTWKNDVELIPTACEHDFPNYVQAANNTTLKYRGMTKGFEPFLAEYPKVHSGEYGPIYLRRTFDPQNLIPDTWESEFTHRLSVGLAEIFKAKRANVLLYFVPDIACYEAIHEKWVGGNFNDIVVVVETDGLESIGAVKIMSWTDNHTFKTNLEFDLSQASWSDPSYIADIILKHVALPSTDGGFQEKSLEDFEYLKNEIHLPVWSSILGFVLMIGWTILPVIAAKNYDIIEIISNFCRELFAN